MKTYASNMTELKQYKKECRELVKAGTIKNVKVRKWCAEWLISWDWC